MNDTAWAFQMTRTSWNAARAPEIPNSSAPNYVRRSMNMQSKHRVDKSLPTYSRQTSLEVCIGSSYNLLLLNTGISEPLSGFHFNLWSAADQGSTNTSALNGLVQGENHGQVADARRHVAAQEQWSLSRIGLGEVANLSLRPVQQGEVHQFRGARRPREDLVEWH